jgi:hypothetical protein
VAEPPVELDDRAVSRVANVAPDPGGENEARVLPIRSRKPVRALDVMEVTHL